ncbi:MAG: rhodanese-like domain-containing protein [Gammaproteobacteria bacterium]|nr:rhodanese-like domain-containing protein [Gammaproteobacteria bacterium]
MAIKEIFAEVEKVKENLDNLGVQELKAEVQSNPDLLLVDLRELQERVDLGTIPGAKHVPRGMLEFWADPSSPYYRDYFKEDRRTIVFCAAGGRSAFAARDLLAMGFKDVAQFDPGFNGWKEAGEAVEDVGKTSRWVRREDNSSTKES